MFARKITGPVLAACSLLLGLEVFTLLGCSSPQPKHAAALPAPPAPSELVVSPGNTPVEGTLRIDAAGLLAGRIVALAFGVAGSDYEILGSVRADAAGLVKTLVRVPSWAELGKEYVIVVQTEAGQQLAVSEPVVIAPTGATLTVVGRFTEHLSRCQAVRTAGGKVYQLELPVPMPLPFGTPLEVTGTIASAGVCPDVTTLTVEKITVK